MGRHRERHEGYVPSGPMKIGEWYHDNTLPLLNDGPWEYYKDQNVIYYTPLWQVQESCDDELHHGPPYLSGGPFDKWKFETDERTAKGQVFMTGWYERYVGGFVPNTRPSTFLTYSSLSDAQSANWGDVSSLGATAWNRFRPTKPKADVAVFLGEFREIPHMLRQTAKGFHKLWKSQMAKAFGKSTHWSLSELGSHWLNTQFGWRPFLRDLRSFYDASKNLSRQVEQLKRDNGQWKKRGGTVKVVNDVEILAQGDNNPYMYPALATSLYNSPWGNYTVKREFTQRVWFSGRFRYYIPSLGTNTWADDALYYAKIFGAMPSPSLVWELTPWSWMIDWATNAGDVISNLSDMLTDGLCAKYAYIMGHTIEKISIDAFANLIASPTMNHWYAQIERKQRIEANPFGFGLTGGDLSAYQWSIVTALGLSRLGIK